MLKKSHRVFGLTLLPSLLINKINNINPNNQFEQHLNKVINSFNEIISSFHDMNMLYMSLFLILFFIGVTFPDIDMKCKFFYHNKAERYLYHRQLTHSLSLNLILLYYSLFYLPDYTYLYFGATAFLLGISTHLIADMLTGSIPIFLYGHYGIPFRRIGITIFFPKSMHKIFTEKLPKLLNKHVSIIILVNSIIFILIFLI